MRITGVLVIGLILLATAGYPAAYRCIPRGYILHRFRACSFRQSNESVPDAVIEVAVFREEGFSQVEMFRNADHVPLKAGETVVSFPVWLEPGKYRCFIYTTSATRRFPAVIRDFEVA